MQTVTLDFETYYDSEYSLSKLSTEAYIRDQRFEAIMCGIKIDDQETKVVVGANIWPALQAINWDDAILVCQNTRFDAAILAWRYGIHPKALADIMGMSRALFPHAAQHSLAVQAQRAGLQAKGDAVTHMMGRRLASLTVSELHSYAEYCANDVELTHQLFHKYLDAGFPKKELRLIDLTLRMFVEPTLVLDEQLLLEHLQEVQQAQAKTLESVADLLMQTGDPEVYMELLGPEGGGVRTLLMSNQRFAGLLKTFGVDPPTKISPTTGKETFAFAKSDEAFKALLEHSDVRVQALVGARLGVKSTLEETRTLRLLDIARRKQGFAVPLQYYGAHSGRWSGTDGINLQNLPSRGPHANKLKKAILAPVDHVLIDCDSAQIEARTLAWLSGQEDLVKAFANKEDVYKLMASAIYHKPVKDILPAERQVGKVVILGAGYGIGPAKLQTYLKMQAGVAVDEDEAAHLVQTYRTRYPYIANLWKRGDLALQALVRYSSYQFSVPPVLRVDSSGIRMPNGLWLTYPGLVREQDGYKYLSRNKSVYLYGAKVVENACQAVARLIIGEQALRIAKRYRVVLTVHDALTVLARAEEQAEAEAYVIECMSWTPKWAAGLPLACEASTARSYGG